MRLNEYQQRANATDQVSDTQRIEALMTPVLGLSGRAGALSTEYLRYLRDGAAYQAFRQRTGEVLGDLLWYVSNIAHKNDLTLEDIARQNLEKTSNRWDRGTGEEAGAPDFDGAFPDNERFPRLFTVDVTATRKSDGTSAVSLSYNGKPFGDPLTDNAEDEDGYRFHDIFHLAFVSHLGWSPVLRGRLFFNCKRKSSPTVDEVEDGGRAAVIDEAIAALIFNEAQKNSYYEGVNSVSIQLLQLIGQLTGHLEVSRCTMAQWEQAILNAFAVWRRVCREPSGRLMGNRETRRIEYVTNS
ncbi:nucleoside triphosphate pyrophosphohydrolase family protein [Burkholderia sp. AU45388]|uniref:nucleoside triphosphate pyrophosphohydrolase family protein n=1 Tax=Burkholderia sp. AU45388 TaxID=3059206 RepID=UPI00264F37EE|nr:nucleoside triphosphate pyrophosphohydrolase family protein [Burkholderia sp. AU45388]MDN7427944.1 nucleoside triphosphate pyrophosphohydrolase family protein [Burkholderia sp. AU45388]